MRVGVSVLTLFFLSPIGVRIVVIAGYPVFVEMIPLRNPEPSAMRRFCEEIDNQLIAEISGWLRVSFFLPLSMVVF